MEKKDVLCIGIACMDVLIKNVDLASPFTGEAKPAEHVSVGVGGDAANEAVVLSRLGHSVQIMCRTADDDAGHFIRGYLQKNKVDLSLSSVAEEGESSINVIVIQENGDRNFINSGIPKAVCFTPDINKMENVKVVSLASLFLPPFADRESVLQTARRAKEIKAFTCLDVIVSEDSRLEEYKEALGYVDYVFPNREEAALLTGKTELEAMADVFLGYGVKNVIIKTGKKGCFVKNKKECFFVPGYPVAQVVDTTGAGDNFAAGFISALVEGKELRDACRYACGVAGVAIQFQGACGGVKSREQVAALLKEMETAVS